MSNDVWEKIKSIPAPGWRHRIDVGDGIITPGREDSTLEFDRLQVDQILFGKSVLDIGCSDGYFSFECEKRGAEVTAIDDFTSTPDSEGVNGFTIAADLLQSKARLLNLSVYQIDELNQQYDVILLINVLYHLRHPALAIDKIYSALAPGGNLYIKTYFHQDFRLGPIGFDWYNRPLAKFFEKDELNGDPSNWWGLNRNCIVGLLRSAGFHKVEQTAIHRDRIYFKARKE